MQLTFGMCSYYVCTGSHVLLNASVYAFMYHLLVCTGLLCVEKEPILILNISIYNKCIHNKYMLYLNMYYLFNIS